MKRFWSTVTIGGDDGAFRVLLDGKPMRLPGGPLVVLHSRALAEAIAEEWRTAGTDRAGDLVLDDIALTRLAGTVQERIAPAPTASAEALATYAATDTLCYHAEGPQALAELQARQWQPWLDWAKTTLGAELLVFAGIMPQRQPPEAIEALRAAIGRLSPAELGGLGIIVPSTGSLVLGLAVAAGALDAAQAADLAALDDIFQAEHWGEDASALARRARIRLDLGEAGRFMKLVAGFVP